MKTNSENTPKSPGLFHTSDLVNFFESLGAFKKIKEVREKEKIKSHPEGMCNNPDCNICKENIQNI